MPVANAEASRGAAIISHSHQCTMTVAHRVPRSFPFHLRFAIIPRINLKIIIRTRWFIRDAACALVRPRLFRKSEHVSFSSRESFIVLRVPACLNLYTLVRRSEWVPSAQEHLRRIAITHSASRSWQVNINVDSMTRNPTPVNRRHMCSLITKCTVICWRREKADEKRKSSMRNDLILHACRRCNMESIVFDKHTDGARKIFGICN